MLPSVHGATADAASSPITSRSKKLERHRAGHGGPQGGKIPYPPLLPNSMASPSHLSPASPSCEEAANGSPLLHRAAGTHGQPSKKRPQQRDHATDDRLPTFNVDKGVSGGSSFVQPLIARFARTVVSDDSKLRPRTNVAPYNRVLPSRGLQPSE